MASSLGLSVALVIEMARGGWGRWFLAALLRCYASQESAQCAVVLLPAQLENGRRCRSVAQHRRAVKPWPAGARPRCRSRRTRIGQSFEVPASCRHQEARARGAETSLAARWVAARAAALAAPSQLTAVALLEQLLLSARKLDMLHASEAVQHHQRPQPQPQPQPCAPLAAPPLPSRQGREAMVVG